MKFKVLNVYVIMNINIISIDQTSAAQHTIFMLKTKNIENPIQRIV